MSSSPYTFLTDELVSEFKGVGTENLIQLLQAPDQSQQEIEDVTSQIFTELLLVYEDGRITIEGISDFLSLAIKEESVAILFCQVCDVFPLSDSLKVLLFALYRKQNIIKPSTLAKFIRSDSLSKSGIVPADVLARQLNTHKRDEFYTQKKYNLLHEETEGYSKFIVELYHILRGEDTKYQVQYAIQVIEKLIGHYSLDPNRSLDILLELYSNHFVGNHEFALKLLKKSQWWPAKESDCYTSIEKLSYGGNETAAKIVGLRLLKYPKDKDLPETFKILIACLVKEGFISFGSIYKYLRPDEVEMKSLEAEYKKQLEEKVFKANASALALAAPLVDDEDENLNTKDNNPSTQNQTEEKQPIEEKLRYNFKFQLLRVFLGNGLYWPSIYILTEYPFLAYINPEIYELVNRLFNSMISPLYDSIKSISNGELELMQTSKKIAYTRPLNNVYYEEFPCIELLSFKPTIKSYSQKKFIYFYTSWTEKLPQIKEVPDLFKYSMEFLKFIGVNLCKDLELFVKICEIGNWDLSNNKDNESRKQEWFQYFRNFIFPAMPLIEENSFAIDKAYSILAFYPLEDRFNLYGELHQVMSKNNPLIKIAYGKAEKSTKDVLKRLSKENVRPMMRRLAKISFSNPLPCLLTILQQIESYDNLNSLVVETARYFNAYGWDVLTLAILMRLTASGRSNVQDDGLNDRQWIQSLASFIGKICHRYPNAIDLHTIITFLLKSFHNKESIGLIVLKEILISMGGIQTITNLTLLQIDMINCGSSLEKLVYRTIDDLRFERYKSGHILVRALLDLGAVNELLILLCQLGDTLIFHSDQSHLKVLTNKNDDLDVVIHLFITLVNFFGNSDELSTALLPISELCIKYQVPSQWAFELWRPLLGEKALTKGSNESVKESLEEIMVQSSEILPKDALKYLTTSIYATFWQLSLYDINYSEELYNIELEKLQSSIHSLKDAISINRKNKDVSRSTIEKYRKELEQNEKFIKEVPNDKEKHSSHNDSILTRLVKESTDWFNKDGVSNIKLQIESFLQCCILPRAIHSSFDAAYTAKFLFKLHELKTPNFSIIILLDGLIRSNILFGTLFTLTPTEAENLGLFFADILKKLHDWTDSNIFEKETKNSTLLNSEGSLIEFNEYRKILYQYHDIILQDIKQALEVKEYMSRRNAITFLKNLLGTYPNVENHCEIIVDLIEKIAVNDDREDLKLSSNALIGHVKSRSKEWVHLWDFIELSDEEKEAHLKKREEIMEKRRKAEMEAKEREKSKEIDQKRKKEKETQDQKKRANLINYDESTSTTSRPATRGNYGSSKGRYDLYSKYGAKVEPEVTPELKSADVRESEPKFSEDKDGEAKTVSKEAESEEKSDVSKEKEEKPYKSSDLKTRLREAKNELKKKSQELLAGTQDSSTSITPEREVKKTESSIAPTTVRRNGPMSAQHTVKQQEESKITKSRTPLPPQRPPGKKETVSESKFNDTGNRRYNDNYNQNRYNNQRSYTQNTSNRPSSGNRPPVPLQPPTNRGSQRSLPPPPPPINLKPQSRTDNYNNSSNGNNSRNGGRYDNKRKHDNYGPTGRGYDKMQRY